MGGIEEGAITHSDDVGGDDLLFVVSEGFGGSGLHGGIDGIDGDIIAFDDGYQDGGAASRDWNTLGGADELAIQFRDDKADGFSGTGAVRDDVSGASAGTAEIAFAVRSIEDHLITGIGMDGGHDAGLDREGIIESFGHRG